MSESTPTALRVERTYNAPAQVVFDAWTSPEVMRLWRHAGDTSWENTAAEVDLRVGGSFRVSMRTPGGREYSANGEYTEIRPPERLAFRWTWVGDEGTPAAGSLVEIDFQEKDGATTVVLTHSGLVSEKSKEGHVEGWEEVLNHLAGALDA